MTCTYRHQGEPKEWHTPNAGRTLKERTEGQVEFPVLNPLHEGRVITVKQMEHSEVRPMLPEFFDGLRQNIGGNQRHRTK